MTRVLGGALLALILAGAVFLPFLQRAPVDESGSAEGSGSTGRRALFLLLGELGFEPQAWRQRPGALPAGKHGLWLSELPPAQGTQAGSESDALTSAHESGLRSPRHYRDFVSQGGHLLLAVDDERLERLRDEFGFDELGSLELIDGTGPKLTPVRWVDGTLFDMQLSGGASLQGLPRSATTLLATGDGERVAALVPVGEGGLVLLCDDDFLENGSIGRHDHGEIAVRLALRFAASRRVLFDEYALGRWQPSSKLDLAFSSSAGWLSWHLLTLLALFTWRLAWVREFPRDPQPHERLSPLSRARALASLMTRARRFDLLAEMLRRGFVARMAEGLHLKLREQAHAPSRGVDESHLTRLLQRAGLERDGERWRSLLIASPIRSAEDLERLGRELDGLEAALFQSKRLARPRRGPQAQAAAAWAGSDERG